MLPFTQEMFDNYQQYKLILFDYNYGVAQLNDESTANDHRYLKDLKKELAFIEGDFSLFKKSIEN